MDLQDAILVGQEAIFNEIDSNRARKRRTAILDARLRDLRRAYRFFDKEYERLETLAAKRLKQ